MLAMVRERGRDGEIMVPPTIQALLQARLDTLDGDERLVIERGAVEGEVFHRGSVAVLAPEPVRPALETHLSRLVRKELIRPHRGTFPNDEAFRFRHLLIRDAAYEALPKATRADLHEQFAEWLSDHDLVEKDEILGYHLEQAHRYRAELDATDPRLEGLASRSARHLAAAGRAALGRGDYKAGRSLLRRSLALFPPEDEERFAPIPELAAALWEAGELDDARALLAEAKQAVDPAVAAMATIVDDVLDSVSAGTLTREERRGRREAAYHLLEAAGDDEGLALYWWAVAGESWNLCRAAEATAASERGLDHVARAGRKGRTDDFTLWTAVAYVYGPTPVAEAVEHVESLLAELGEGTLLHAYTSAALARLWAMRGDVESGRSLHVAARNVIREAGLVTTAAAMAMGRAWIEERADDHGAAERELRASLEELERLNDRAFRATAAANLGENLYLRGELDEVRELCALVREESPEDDRINWVYLGSLEACLLSHEGAFEESEARGREALELADSTDYFFARGRARLYLATVLARAGRAAESAALANDGLAIFEAKGDVTGFTWSERLLRSAGVVAG
jgi:tetratricopeptide (TPR) repeat protein